jgi:hypothetical protein
MVVAVAVVLVLLGSSPHESAMERAATVVLVIVQAGWLAWMRAYPEA